MKKLNIKSIIIALIIALSLIGTTVFVCVTLFNNNGNDGGDDDSGYQNPGNIDDGGWTTPNI